MFGHCLHRNVVLNIMWTIKCPIKLNVGFFFCAQCHILNILKKLLLALEAHDSSRLFGLLKIRNEEPHSVVNSKPLSNGCWVHIWVQLLYVHECHARGLPGSASVRLSSSLHRLVLFSPRRVLFFSPPSRFVYAWLPLAKTPTSETHFYHSTWTANVCYP